jgi:hypothetical protein
MKLIAASSATIFVVPVKWLESAYHADGDII